MFDFRSAERKQTLAETAHLLEAGQEQGVRQLRSVDAPTAVRVPNRKGRVGDGKLVLAVQRHHRRVALVLVGPVLCSVLALRAGGVRDKLCFWVRVVPFDL